MQKFTRDNVPTSRLRWYERKVIGTLMMRVNGPFSVETREGELVCEDGWLAVYMNGDPYPIADDVQKKTFHPIHPLDYEEEK